MSIFGRHILNISTGLQRLLPAQPCLLCGAFSRDGLWCAACDTALPQFTTAICPVCALPTPGGEVCGHCLKRPPHFERTIAAFGYAFPVDRMIQALKYGERLALAPAFAERLAQRIEHPPDLILPMPLHPLRLRERGFNQSLELARNLARKLERPLLIDAAQRVRDTAPQAGLRWKERKRNMRDAFACNMALRGQHVAMVDDVMTSGATLDELARTLRRAGAGEISAWVVARTARRVS